MVPERPLTMMLEGYGDPFPSEGIVIALAFVNTTACGVGDVIHAKTPTRIPNAIFRIDDVERGYFIDLPLRTVKSKTQ